MGIARRQRRAWKRAYDKATKRQSVTPVTLRDNLGLQEKIDQLLKDYETNSSGN